MQDEKKPARQITYQIGRKQGMILLDEQGRPIVQGKAGKHDHKASGRAVPGLIRFVWKEAPAFSLGVWVMLLCAAPIVTASASFWLVLLLSKHGS